MGRGVLYLKWTGDCDPSNVLERSLMSLKYWHPELPYTVHEMPAGSNLLVKSRMFDISPYDETLFLDADTAVMGKLDYGFMQADKFGIACCINANPWQRRFYKIDQHPDEVEYSSGVIFFNKYRWRVDEVFRRWNELNATTDTRSQFVSDEGLREQPVNDQALFTLAMQQLKFNPFILPLNWNLYPKWQKHFWGEIKIWHGYADIPEALMKWNADQSRREAVIQCAGLP